MPAAMEKGGILVCVLIALNLLLVASESAKKPLTIAAFNIQVFGQSKMGKPEVVNILKEIVHRYDIILIQEIRDKTENTVPDFVALVNDDDSKDHYGAVLSERLGRTNSKEQYTFLYRSAVLDVISVYQYNDIADRFERAPFSVQFRTKKGQEEFFLLGIHVKPSDALQELESLLPAFQETSNVFRSEKGVIMGDLNAGCRYLSRGSYDQLSLVINPNFIWLLGYDADTTVGSSSCPYDRFIVHKPLDSSVIPMSATIFNFTEAYSLTTGEAKKVSDHFPIEFQLQLRDSGSDSKVSSSGFKVTSTLATAGLVVIAIISCYN